MQTPPVMHIYDRLVAHFGPQQWWPAQHPFEMMVGAILTQATAWTNAEQALQRLRAAGWLSPTALQSSNLTELAHCIRPAGYFNTKARKLKAFTDLLIREHHGNVNTMLQTPGPTLRRQLLGVYGIGPETADCILLYAAGLPYFVVDAYTRRIFGRLGLCSPTAPYGELQQWLVLSLPEDAQLFNEYHALLVQLGKVTCRKNQPACDRCPLQQLCRYATTQRRAPAEAATTAPSRATGEDG